MHSVGGKVVPRPEVAKLDFTDEALARVRSGMNRVMNEGGGTAYSWRITEPGFEMAGKTGTAQVRAYSQEEHARGITKNSALDWKLRDHALVHRLCSGDRSQICHRQHHRAWRGARPIPMSPMRAMSCCSASSAIPPSCPPPIR